MGEGKGGPLLVANIKASGKLDVRQRINLKSKISNVRGYHIKDKKSHLLIFMYLSKRFLE